MIRSPKHLEQRRDELHKKRAGLLKQELDEKPLQEDQMQLFNEIEAELEELDHLHIIRQLYEKLRNSVVLNLSQQGSDLYHNLALEFSRKVRSYISPIEPNQEDLDPKTEGRLFNVCSVLEKPPSYLLEHLYLLEPLHLS